MTEVYEKLPNHHNWNKKFKTGAIQYYKCSDCGQKVRQDLSVTSLKMFHSDKKIKDCQTKIRNMKIYEKAEKTKAINCRKIAKKLLDERCKGHKWKWNDSLYESNVFCEECGLCGYHSIYSSRYVYTQKYNHEWHFYLTRISSNYKDILIKFGSKNKLPSCSELRMVGALD